MGRKLSLNSLMFSKEKLYYHNYFNVELEPLKEEAVVVALNKRLQNRREKERPAINPRHFTEPSRHTAFLWDIGTVDHLRPVNLFFTSVQYCSSDLGRKYRKPSRRDTNSNENSRSS